MKQLHFFTTEVPMSADECKELSETLQEMLKLKGLENHLAVVMSMVKYTGTVTDVCGEEPF